jgi:hypothetical protein
MKKKFYLNIFLLPVLSSLKKLAFDQQQVSLLQKDNSPSDYIFCVSQYALKIQHGYFFANPGSVDIGRIVALASS